MTARRQPRRPADRATSAHRQQPADGVHHLDPEGLEADAHRTRALEELGLTVIRFLDNEVLSETDGVVQVILDRLEVGVAEGR